MRRVGDGVDEGEVGGSTEKGEEGEEDLHIEENRATNHKTTLVRYKSKMLPKDEHKR